VGNALTRRYDQVILPCIQGRAGLLITSRWTWPWPPGHAFPVEFPGGGHGQAQGQDL